MQVISNRILSYSFAFFFFFAMGCKKDDIHFDSAYEQSYRIWSQFKEQHNDSYYYVTRGDSWAGFSWETQIVVKDGVVTERHFSYTHFNQIARPTDGWNEAAKNLILNAMDLTPEEFSLRYTRDLDQELAWSEVGASLGENTNTAAASPWDMDQVYSWSRKLLKSDPARGKIYFETDHQGLIALCGYVPSNCMDDCFTGIRINRIQPLSERVPAVDR